MLSWAHRGLCAPERVMIGQAQVTLALLDPDAGRENHSKGADPARQLMGSTVFLRVLSVHRSKA